MNPLGVLRAADVMEPVSSALAAQPVAADTPINQVMRALLAEDTCVGVEREGALIGQVTKATVLRRLLDPRRN